MPDKFYGTSKWKKISAKVKARWVKEGLPCYYCGHALVKEDRLTVDHVINRRKRPDLALNLNNLVVVHHACNTKKYYEQEAKDVPMVGVDGFPINSEWSK